ncbi:MAG TPA: SRPBCC family protein [Verrucomicrobiae bacterium]|nr:SRPBCC family protein [Verrucomicrobiae bacterium]
MKEFKFQTEIWLPRRREEVFPFFADARNLQIITPPWLKFQALTPMPVEMKVGARIDYQLHVHGFPLRWQSEITAWEAPYRFVDEQRKGPYRRWVHEHVFEMRPGGTLCRDNVRYAAPGGWLIEQLFVRRDLERIFAFRSKKLMELFGDGRCSA